MKAFYTLLILSFALLVSGAVGASVRRDLDQNGIAVENNKRHERAAVGSVNSYFTNQQYTIGGLKTGIGSVDQLHSGSGFSSLNSYSNPQQMNTLTSLYALNRNPNQNPNLNTNFKAAVVQVPLTPLQSHSRPVLQLQQPGTLRQPGLLSSQTFSSPQGLVNQYQAVRINNT